MGEYIDFDHVKTYADFAAILAHNKIKLFGSGDERRCLCPFHDDQRPPAPETLVEKSQISGPNIGG